MSKFFLIKFFYWFRISYFLDQAIPELWNTWFMFKNSNKQMKLRVALVFWYRSYSISSPLWMLFWLCIQKKIWLSKGLNKSLKWIKNEFALCEILKSPQKNFSNKTSIENRVAVERSWEAQKIAAFFRRHRNQFMWVSGRLSCMVQQCFVHISNVYTCCTAFALKATQMCTLLVVEKLLKTWAVISSSLK